MTRDYLGFLAAVDEALIGLGATVGAVGLSRYEIDMACDAHERGEGFADFAAWVLKKRGTVRLPSHDDRDVFGSETISPKELAA